MIASLPMYDTPATRGANDRLWAAIRDNLGSGPATLDRSAAPHSTWTRPDLLFSQTCGLPFRAGLHKQVRLIATPDYGVPGCPPGYYTSALVVRADDPRQKLAAFTGARLARNDARSQSGWAALVQAFQDSTTGDFNGSVLTTGSHVGSVDAIYNGQADLAAIDAVTWALLARDTTATENLRVLTYTPPTPGLPYITGPRQNAERLYDAVASAVTGLSHADRSCLMLRGLVRIPAADYLRVPLPTGNVTAQETVRMTLRQL